MSKYFQVHFKCFYVQVLANYLNVTPSFIHRSCSTFLGAMGLAGERTEKFDDFRTPRCPGARRHGKFLDFHLARMKFTLMNLIYRPKFSDMKYLFLAHLRVFVLKNELY